MVRLPFLAGWRSNGRELPQGYAQTLVKGAVRSRRVQVARRVSTEDPAVLVPEPARSGPDGAQSWGGAQPPCGPTCTGRLSTEFITHGFWWRVCSWSTASAPYRSNSWPRATLPSSRASGAPRQKWMPCPNAR